MSEYALRVYRGNPLGEGVSTFLGSAFAIDEMLGMTAGHIFDEFLPDGPSFTTPTEFYVIGNTTGGSARRIEQLFLAKYAHKFNERDSYLESDMCIFTITGDEKFSIAGKPECTTTLPNTGAEITLWGFPNPDEAVHKINAAFVTENHTTGTIILDSGIEKGMSGGPIVSDGKLVGMTVGRISDAAKAEGIPYKRLSRYISYTRRQIISEKGAEVERDNTLRRPIAIISTDENSQCHQDLKAAIDLLNENEALRAPGEPAEVKLHTEFEGIPIDYETVRDLLSMVEVCFVIISEDDLKNEFKLASLFSVLSFFRERLGRPRVRIVQGNSYRIFNDSDFQDLHPDPEHPARRSFPDLSRISGVLIRNGYDPLEMRPGDVEQNTQVVFQFLGVLNDDQEDDNGLVDFVKVIHPNFRGERRKTFDAINRAAQNIIVTTGIGFSNLLKDDNIEVLLTDVLERDLVLWLLAPAPDLVNTNKEMFGLFRAESIPGNHLQLMKKFRSLCGELFPDGAKRRNSVSVTFHKPFLPFIAYASDYESPLGKMIIRHVFPSALPEFEDDPEHQIYVVKRSNGGIYDRYASAIKAVRAMSPLNFHGDRLDDAVAMLEREYEFKE